MDKSLVNSQLAEFAANPVQFMQEQCPKFDANGTAIEEPITVFEQGDIETKQYIAVGDEARGKHVRIVNGVVRPVSPTLPGRRAPIASDDRPVNLVDRLSLRTLQQMEAADLVGSTLDESPWSDDYWAIYLGQLAKRYADPAYPNSSNWEENYEYYSDNLPNSIASSGSSDAINKLAPAEKYDLLVGDGQYSLTQFMWAQGKYYYDRHGKVETWMGVCHGWAPAAYMLPRPKTYVDVLSANGTTIRFYPSDIKALASQLWASARTATRFIGNRCNIKDPELDDNGRPVDIEGFDNNPATWHLSVVNQIGASRRSFIIDATYDYEVWNQPVYGYKYSYFNPELWQYVDTLDEAIVTNGSFDDRWTAFRSPNARYIVGIGMKVDYVAETSPTTRPSDSASHDKIVSVTYLYDLELDRDHQIIGGEWYRNTHPDFLWTPASTTRARGPYDDYVEGNWNSGSAIPADWKSLARRSSGQGLPLAAIVDELIRRARS